MRVRIKVENAELSQSGVLKLPSSWQSHLDREA